jgi:2-polyprenyl-3-methyl-5-hydroxy-6-metoxy-1,4-benzoquinol methylase
MNFERIADQKRLDFILGAIFDAAPSGSHVLDIGCGNGIIAKAIATKGFQVRAIDVSDKTIEEARKSNGHPNIQYEVVPAGQLSDERDRYHAIICSEVLEHLDDPSSLLQIVRSALAKTGIVIVTVPNGSGPREVLVTKPVQRIQSGGGAGAKMLEKIKRFMGYPGTTVQSNADDLRHIQFFSHRSLRQLALKNGFRIALIRPTNFIEQVFPVSLLTRKSKLLQKWDISLAEMLPLGLSSGFMSVWKKM